MKPETNRAERLERLLRERIVILDGAMGTMVQQHQLDERAYRGERFRQWRRDLKGLHDLLALTQPQIIEGIHRQYLEAGADLIETNTFNAQALSLADYGMESLAYEINVAAARCARRAADAVMAANPSRVCIVAGALGPTNKTSSISTDVNNPAARGASFDEVAAAYYEQAKGLLDGGADALLVETIFDTLNAKAAFFAILKLFEECGIEPLTPFDARRETVATASGGGEAPVTPAGAPPGGLRFDGDAEQGGRGSGRSPKRIVPIMASVTFIQAGSNRGVTGQTVEAFWNSISHVPLLSVGMNCALGPKELRPLVEELSGLVPLYVSAYPNAGLPNPLLPTGFPETPETLAPQLREWAEAGFLNIVGGCCGTTPRHIQAIAEAVRGLAPRVPPKVERSLRLSGLDAVMIRGADAAGGSFAAPRREEPPGAGPTDAREPGALPAATFVNIGERTNVAGSPKFAQLIKAGDFEAALSVARQQVENGASPRTASAIA